MHYYEVTVVEYNEHYGYYYKKDSTCSRLALILNWIASYYASLCIMKSWISNFFQPWQSVPTTTKSQVHQSGINTATYLTATQSQPIQISMAAPTLPGSNLYDMYNMNASDPYCHTKNVCQTTVSLGYIALGTTRPCRAELCNRAFVAVGTPSCVSTFSKLRNSLMQSSPALEAAKHQTGLWSMPHLPHSAPSALCAEAKFRKNTGTSEIFHKADASVIMADNMLSVANCTPTDAFCRLSVTDNSCKNQHKQPDIEHPSSSTCTSQMHVQAGGTSPKKDCAPSFMSCKNPLISYILGCSVDNEVHATSDGDDTWSEADDCEELDVFNGSNPQMQNDTCNKVVSLSESLSSCSSSDVMECYSDSEDEQSRISTSSSDYWSDDEPDDDIDQPTISEPPSTDTTCKLLKPFCTNPLINFILNCSDPEDELELQESDNDAPPPEVVCHRNDEWENMSFMPACAGSHADVQMDNLERSYGHQNLGNLVRTPKKACKVTFTDKPPTVHHMFAWSFAYKQSRRGPWECHARDRERFRARILEVERAISWCLLPRHRASTWKKLAFQ